MRPSRRSAFAMILVLLGSGGCSGPGDQPFLSRPAPAPGGRERLAFTARGRVWVAQPAGNGWQAYPLAPGDDCGLGRTYAAMPCHPAEHHHDRPVWFADGDSLALTVWLHGQSDLAVTRALPAIAVAHDADGPTTFLPPRNLTRTPDEDEILNDISPDGRRLLFEHRHQLWELELSTGTRRALVRGRDGRYTPDGGRVLFVLGNDTSALGVWREGYRGGDDSEIMVLDLATGEVTALTVDRNNDEQPVPLDDSGRTFIAVSEWSGPYHPWYTEALSQRVLRRRRPPIPDRERPARFPAVQRDGDTTHALWFEQDGALFQLDVELSDEALLAGAVRRVEVELHGDTEAPHAGWLARLRHRPSHADPRWYGAALYKLGEHALSRSPLTREPWRALTPSTRRRFKTEMARVATYPAAVEIFSRLLGRFGLSHLYFEPAWGMPAVPPIASHAARDSLAHRLAAHGVDYLALDRLDSEAVEMVAGLGDTEVRTLVLDLRDNRGGYSHEALLLILCGQTYADDHNESSAAAGSTRIERPLVALISQHTYSSGEILAQGIRDTGCGSLVGRHTAGAVLEARSRSFDGGGRLVVPYARPNRRDGTPFEGEMVKPSVYVPGRLDPDREEWLAPILEALERAGVAARL